VGQLAQFLGAQPGQAQGLDGGPLPERLVLLLGDVDQLAGGEVDGADGRPSLVSRFQVGPACGAPVGDSGVGERLAVAGGGSGLEQVTGLVPAVVDRGGQDRHERLPVVGAFGDAFLVAPAALVDPAQVGVADRARRDPACPVFRFGGGPALDVQ
jgi:hypothetical protein